MLLSAAFRISSAIVGVTVADCEHAQRMFALLRGEMSRGKESVSLCRELITIFTGTRAPHVSPQTASSVASFADLHLAGPQHTNRVVFISYILSGAEYMTLESNPGSLPYVAR